MSTISDEAVKACAAAITQLDDEQFNRLPAFLMDDWMRLVRKGIAAADAVRERENAGSECDGLWRCSQCGEPADAMSSRWRWSGEEWQHHHGAHVGHVNARYFGSPAQAIIAALRANAGGVK